jgi:hypothetical protein
VYLKEENESLHTMIEQLQDEKERISCKLIEEQGKVESTIKDKDR